MIEYSRNLKPPSRELRKNMTDAERVLWSRLRGKQLLDVQFYRQKPIGPFIVDFYCHAAALVIEVDGGQHYEAEHVRKDAERDRYLAEAGLQVVRFDNRKVLLETDAVVEKILMVMQERQIPPCPPLQSGVKANPPRPPLSKGGEKTKKKYETTPQHTLCYDPGHLPVARSRNRSAASIQETAQVVEGATGVEGQCSCQSFFAALS